MADCLYVGNMAGLTRAETSPPLILPISFRCFHMCSGAEHTPTPAGTSPSLVRSSLQLWLALPFARHLTVFIEQIDDHLPHRGGGGVRVHTGANVFTEMLSDEPGVDRRHLLHSGVTRCRQQITVGERLRRCPAGPRMNPHLLPKAVNSSVVFANQSSPCCAEPPQPKPPSHF